MAVVWSDIPEELIYMFVEKLVCIDDLIRFSCVCKLWRSVSISEKENKKKKAYAPLMMLANADNDTLPSDGEEGVRSFVIPYYTDGGDGGANPKKMRSFEIELPKAQGRRCWGSPYGWLVTTGMDLSISLLNPLTAAQLPLPSQLILQDQSFVGHGFSALPGLDPRRNISGFTRKITLGWHASSQSWLVMAIFGAGEEVAFTFTNEAFSSSSWTCLKSTVDAEDVILFQDRIYILAFGGQLKVFDSIKEEEKEGTRLKAIHIASPPKQFTHLDTYNLVEIGGNLHFVARYFVQNDQNHYLTTDFNVWRFNFSDRKWYELDDVGEYALFLGNNTSFALSTTTYPHLSRNCVYFTDHEYVKYNDSFCDMGVFDYKEKTIKPFDIGDMCVGAFSKFSRPTFFMPTL